MGGGRKGMRTTLPSLEMLPKLQVIDLGECKGLMALPNASAFEQLTVENVPYHLEDVWEKKCGRKAINLLTGEGLQGSHSAHCPLLPVPTAH